MSGKMKGIIGELPLLMLVGLIAMITVVVAFLYLKVHITGIAVDTNSINRYQEIPTTILADSVFIEDKAPISAFGKDNPDSRPKKEINCFRGDGPAGAHQEINKEVCTKRLSFFYTKYANDLGEPALSSTPTDFKNNLNLVLPTNCYSISFSSNGVKIDQYLDDSGDCNLNLPKIDKTYPIPVFLSGEAKVADQVLKIGNSLTRGEELLVTWPKYGTNFRFPGGSQP